MFRGLQIFCYWYLFCYLSALNVFMKSCDIVALTALVTISVPPLVWAIGANVMGGDGSCCIFSGCSVNFLFSLNIVLCPTRTQIIDDTHITVAADISIGYSVSPNPITAGNLNVSLSAFTFLSFKHSITTFHSSEDTNRNAIICMFELDAHLNKSVTSWITTMPLWTTSLAILFIVLQGHPRNVLACHICPHD